MKTEEIITLAKKEGFQNASVIATDKIVFDAAFRPYCEENLCGQYGANYSCPPACGTADEMKARVLAYPNALVLQTKWEIESFSEKEKLMRGKQFHNDAMFRLIKQMREQGHNGFMIGASGCSLCSPCLMREGKPCRFPEFRYSCMSAYCIYVKKLAEACGMVYDYKDGILPYFGMYVF
ncbi:MAG: DUF2284 domain-containing protein [Clostridia bacterium]|nr:DUF2284 domain-containing protein [Clostridia bacterium]